MRVPAPRCGRRCSRTGSLNCAKASGCVRTMSRLDLPDEVLARGAGAARLRRRSRRAGRPAVGSAGHGRASAVELLDDMSAASDVPGRFVAAAGMVRHLLTDPVLPDELLPDGWPGAALRNVLRAIRRRTGGQTKRVRTDGGDMRACESSATARSPRSIMNRPEARNAVNGPTAAELFAAFDEFDKRRLGVGRGAVGRQRNLLRRCRSQGVRHTGRQPRAPDRARADGTDAGWCCPSR